MISTNAITMTERSSVVFVATPGFALRERGGVDGFGNAPTTATDVAFPAVRVEV